MGGSDNVCRATRMGAFGLWRWDFERVASDIKLELPNPILIELALLMCDETKIHGKRFNSMSLTLYC